MPDDPKNKNFDLKYKVQNYTNFTWPTESGYRIVNLTQVSKNYTTKYPGNRFEFSDFDGKKVDERHEHSAIDFWNKTSNNFANIKYELSSEISGNESEGLVLTRRLNDSFISGYSLNSLNDD